MVGYNRRFAPMSRRLREHFAGAGEPLDDRRVVRRDEIIEHPRATAGSHPLGAEDVLVHDRQAIKNPVFAFAASLVRPFGRLKRGVRGNGDEGIEPGVVSLNPVQQGANQLHGAEFATFQAPGKLRQGLCV